MDQKEMQAVTNRRVGSHVPHDGWNVTVAIVVANRPAVHLLGTGSLFEIGGYRFVVTAAHVINLAHQYDKTIGISDGHESLVALPGNWQCSVPQSDSVEDLLDVAIYRLPLSALERMKQVSFLRREDIDFSEQSKTAVFSLLGFPGIWAKPSRSEGERVSLTPLEYTTHAYAGSTESLIGYNARYHLLLDSSVKDMTQQDGSPAVIVKKDGQAATGPRDLEGVSGCAVWNIGDLEVPLDQWRNRRPKVVAVNTGVYQKSQVGRATRWVAVTTLINEAFPELRPALRLSIQD
jgi:hypothetical protein